MGVRHRLTVFGVAATIAIGGGCKRSPPPEDRAPPPRPPDHLAPGEQPIGSEKAFALPLPRVSRVGSRYGGTIAIVSPLSPEEMANFVRIHVKGGNVVAGTTATEFHDVYVTDEPNRKLTIDIRASRPLAGYKSEMTVRDTTPLPLDPKDTPEDRWRKAGFKPDGTPLDPKHVQ